MYIPPHFAVTDPAELHRILRAHPLGALVLSHPDGLDADHLPFEFDPSRGPLGTLSGHIARANPLWRRCGSGCDALVVFRGAEAYISPNWYPSKHEAHRQVPTWNYEVVHAHGRLEVLDDARFVRGLLARLTRQHEAGEPVPWKMGDSAADFIDGLLAQVVGIELTVTALVGKSKLSQNKASRDRLGAADALAARGSDDLAEVMRGAQ